jgi:hypothetical protein
MGRRQTETSYQSEAAYLKSVLLWLQGNWTGPDPPRFYSLRAVEQASSPNRRGEIVDLPAFLPPRSSSQYRQRKA